MHDELSESQKKRECCRWCISKFKTRPWRYIIYRYAAAVTLQVGFIVCIALLNGGSSANYGQVVTFETDQWSKGAIVDIIAQQANSNVLQGCPLDYELVPVSFPGVRATCDKSSDDRSEPDNLGYTLRSCDKNNHGQQRAGVSPQSLPIFDGKNVCVKRDPNLTYHSLVTQRDDDRQCKSTNKCGSQTIKDKNYCLSDNQCPANEVYIGPANYSGASQFFLTKPNFTKNQILTIIKDSSLNNPVAELFIAPSQPCGIRPQSLTLRKFEGNTSMFAPLYKLSLKQIMMGATMKERMNPNSILCIKGHSGHRESMILYHRMGCWSKSSRSHLLTALSITSIPIIPCSISLSPFGPNSANRSIRPLRQQRWVQIFKKLETMLLWHLSSP